MQRNLMTPKLHAQLVQWLAQDKDVRFYQSKAWRTLRAYRLRYDNQECQACKQQGKHTPATVVHHVVHVRDNPSLALDLFNLQSLCNSCHNLAHPEKLLEQQNAFMVEERW